MTDAYVLLSYGGPDKPDDVIPFLRNAVRGRAIPDERLAAVGEHYFLFGGKSPINELNARLTTNIRAELERRGDSRPVVVANRNWHAFGDDVFRELYDAGARSIRAIATSAYGSYSSCRQYREDVARWLGELGYEDLHVEKVEPFWEHEAFIGGYRRATEQALAKAPDNSRLLFVTHSIPTAMNTASGKGRPLTYEEQHLEVARRIAADLGIADSDWDMTYCSRSGSPHTPWLEPDINDHIGSLASAGDTEGVIVVPIGFISDHMEVIYDLDTEAKDTATGHGLTFVRANTIDTDPEFVSALADLFQQPVQSFCSEICCWASEKAPAVAAL